MDNTKTSNSELITNAVNLRESGALEESLEEFKNLKEKFEKEKNYRDLVNVLGGMKINYQLLADNLDEKDPEHDKKALEYLVNVESSINKSLYLIAMHKDVIPEGHSIILLVHSASAKLNLSKYIKDDVEKKVKLISALQDVNDAIDKLPGSLAHKAWPISTKAKILMELGELEDAIEIVEEGYIFLKDGYEEEMKNNDGERNLAIWEASLKTTEACILEKLGRTEEALALLKTVVASEPPENNPSALEVQKAAATKLINKFASKLS